MTCRIVCVVFLTGAALVGCNETRKGPGKPGDPGKKGPEFQGAIPASGAASVTLQMALK
jgi:hypothetical protein